MSESFEDDCRRLNKNCDKLLEALLAQDRLMPAVIVEHKVGQTVMGRGIAFMPSASNMGIKSGEVVIFWSDGDMTAADYVDEIVGDAWEVVYAAKPNVDTPAGNQSPPQLQ